MNKFIMDEIDGSFAFKIVAKPDDYPDDVRLYIAQGFDGPILDGYISKSFANKLANALQEAAKEGA